MSINTEEINYSVKFKNLVKAKEELEKAYECKNTENLKNLMMKKYEERMKKYEERMKKFDEDWKKFDEERMKNFDEDWKKFDEC